MRKLATNFVWSHDSSKGQKGKQKLENMKIYDIIKSIWIYIDICFHKLNQKLENV